MRKNDKTDTNLAANATADNSTSARKRAPYIRRQYYRGCRRGARRCYRRGERSGSASRTFGCELRRYSYVRPAYRRIFKRNLVELGEGATTQKSTNPLKMNGFLVVFGTCRGQDYWGWPNFYNICRGGEKDPRPAPLRKASFLGRCMGRG